MQASTEKTPKVYFCCPNCGSTAVQVPVWADPNTNEVVDSDGPGSYCWCEQCSSSGHDGEFKYLAERDDPQPLDMETDYDALVEAWEARSHA
ncbi:MAG: hypothetical protein QNJ97_17770 [Myxococcota bacterium]|nr:hypothetical protein [Myxococcota bacterium]